VLPQLPRPLSIDWRVDAVLASSETPATAAPLPAVSMRVAVSHSPSEQQPLPPTKAAVLSNPERYATERATERAVAAALDSHDTIAREAATLMGKGSMGGKAGVSSFVDNIAGVEIPPRVAVAKGFQLTMTQAQYLAFATELRAAKAALKAVVSVSE
jgi:pyruvate kinase